MDLSPEINYEECWIGNVIADVLCTTPLYVIFLCVSLFYFFVCNDVVFLSI